MIRFEDAPAFWMPRVLLRTFCALALVLDPRVRPRAAGHRRLGSRRAPRRSASARTTWRLSGDVEIKQGNDEPVRRDASSSSPNEDRAVATGNVVFTQGGNRISADRADFNTKTRLGTFYNATGIASVQPPRQAPQPGAFVAPQLLGQDTNVFFFGESVEKLGPKKYKIRNGGFTTCVQPTPRWNLHADTVVLNVDHYTTLRQAVFMVKGVPMLYLPFMYYPTNKDNRATGFLIPTYGSSTLRGQSIHNAFFWAINRSQDATILHDWFSKTGQGVGSEYRYNFGGGSDGNVRAYMLDQHEATYPQTDGTTTTVPASRSYEVRGGANQKLPWAAARAGERQLLLEHHRDADVQHEHLRRLAEPEQLRRQRRRRVGHLHAERDGQPQRVLLRHDELGRHGLGAEPPVHAQRAAAVRHAAVLLGQHGQYDDLLRDAKVEGSPDVNTGQSRLDFYPQIRFPFKKWQWFTVNSSLIVARHLLHAELRDRPDDGQAGGRSGHQTRAVIADSGVNRRFFTMQAQMVGPVFTRIWDTPNNRYAEKFKHTIEPFLNIQRTSSIDNANEIVQLDGIDYVVGGTTQYTYGVNNRFYAKRRLDAGPAGPVARDPDRVPDAELLHERPGLAIRPAVRDPASTGPPRRARRRASFRPMQLAVRSQLTDTFNTTVSAEVRQPLSQAAHDLGERHVRVVGPAPDQLRLEQDADTSPSSPGSTTRVPHALDDRLRQRSHARENRLGSIYSFNYDVQHSAMLQQHDLGLLQRPVLRDRVSVPVVQFRRPRLERARAGRPPVLPVVHARRSRQLLALQRRDERRPALTRDPGTDARAMSSVVLVTGAAGFAGSHLVDRLRDAGGPVVGWHRPGGAAPQGATWIAWEAVDLLDRAAVRDAIARLRPSAVYHCAGAAHVGRSWASSGPTLAVNVRGTHYLLDALRTASVQARVLVPSSAMVYASADVPLTEDHALLPASPYALSKLAQEMLARHDTDGVQVMVARAFNHFGPRQDPWFVASGFARRIADVEKGRWEPEITVGNLDTRRDLTDVRDMVRAYQLILEHGRPARVYNVCSGRAIAIRDLLDLLLARARVPVAIRVDPARYRPNDVPIVVGNPDRIHGELGWTAEIPIEQTLDDLLEYWRAQ